MADQWVAVAWKYPQGVVRILSEEPGTHAQAETLAAQAHAHYYGEDWTTEGSPRFLPMRTTTSLLNTKPRRSRQSRRRKRL